MATFKAKFKESEGQFRAHFSQEEGSFLARFDALQTVVKGSYPDLTDKPSINGVTLIYDKSFEELGVETLTNLEIKSIFDRVFRRN